MPGVVALFLKSDLGLTVKRKFSKLSSLFRINFTMADVKPNHTLYINNLNEKVKKDGKYGIASLNKQIKIK
jgi:hypothetical protein